MQNNGTRWLSKTVYIDIDTGEVLTTKYAKLNYTIIKTKTTTKLINGWYIKDIEHLCERDKQLTLF